MLFRKHIVSTRTLFQLTVAVLFFVAAVGAAVAANSGNPPLLVPYTASTVAGNTQYDNSNGTGYVAGYAGDGGPAVPTSATSGSAVLNGPFAIAVDSVGNVYIADRGNDVIREVNYATGVINTIAGATPTGCSGVNCSPRSGCADGALAYQGKIGNGLWGVAVDSFGNVYFSDSSSDTVSVVYRGGQRVADFIKRVNPAGVANSGGTVQVGYVYHIAGTVSLNSCAGVNSNSAGLVMDNLPAFGDTSASGYVTNSSATLSAPGSIALDSAGNIYVHDRNDNTTRVINTQETAQTFFEYTVQPGYMRSITNCNAALTIPCPSLTTSELGTGINGPTNGIVRLNQINNISTDAYGNLFQVIGTGGGTAPPGIFGPVSYAGGAPVTNLLNAVAPTLTSVFSATETSFTVPPVDAPTPNMFPLTYGNAYVALGSPVAPGNLGNGFLNVDATDNSDYDIRPGSYVPDNSGSMYYLDEHYGEVSRVDQFTSDAIAIISSWGGHPRPSASVGGLNTVQNVNALTGANTNSSKYNQPASFSNPWDCVIGTSSGGAWNSGPQSFDPVGDGCPGLTAGISGLGGNGNQATTLNDSLGNLYIEDKGFNQIREIEVGTQFPAAPVGASTPVTQPIQVHFDATNPPLTGGAVQGTFTSVAITTPNGGTSTWTTDAFSIPAGSDFSIDTTTPEFPMGALFSAAPWNDNAGSHLALYPTAGKQGYPTCDQLGVTSTPSDNSWDCLVYVKFNPSQPGLRTGQLLVTTANNSVYTFALTGIGQGGQLAIDGGQQSTLTATLGSANAVAVDSTGNVYIADPANNRIVEEPVGGAQINISSFSLISSALGPLPTPLGAGISGSPAPTTNNTLSGPMGVAVDGAGNVYISDTGNNRILKYNPATNSATQLGNYLWIPGAACDGGSGTLPNITNCTYAGFVPPGSPAGTPTPTSILNDTGASVTATQAPPQYTFKAPQGLAVDTWGNVYVADTGNKVVVEIPANALLGGATPLMQYAGAPTLTSPVGVAVDAKGYVYVADSGNAAGQIVRIPPGGGDLQPAGTGFSALDVLLALPTFDGQSVTTTNGVAVDAAGNVYISDSGTNTVVEAPAVAGTSVPFTLSFAGLSGPAGLALDPNGNLYVADSGNSRVLQMNRQSPVVPFGTVPQDLGSPSGVAGSPAGCPVLGGNTPCTGVLTVTNIGNQPVPLVNPFLSAITNPEFTISTTCSGTIQPGTTCTISPLFTPTSDGAATDNVTVNGSQSIAMMGGAGANPEVSIALSASTLAPLAGTTPTLTATVTQPHVLGAPIPSGTVTFNYTIDANTENAGLCGSGGTSGPIALSNTGVAQFTMPAVGAGLVYTVTAVFTPGASDTTDSITNSIAIALAVPAATAETVTATPVTYTYGQPVPAITGTPNPPLPAGVTVSFVGINASGVVASQFSPPGTYPIQAVFAGGAAACGLGFPSVTSTGTTQATVTEKQATLTIQAGTYTTIYGELPQVNYGLGLTITGAVGDDLKKLSATYSPSNSSILDVGSYPVVPTVTGKPINSGDYITPSASTTPPSLIAGTLTVAPSPSVVAVTTAQQTGANSALGLAAATYVPESAMTTTNFPIAVSTQLAASSGNPPTGTVTVYDTFIPITPSSFVPTGVNGSIPLPCSSTVTVNCVPSTDSVILPCATGAASATCTPTTVVNLTAGAGTFALPANSGASPYYTSTGAVVPGTHYFTFVYSGDPAPAVAGGSDGKGDYSCSVVGPTSVLVAGQTTATSIVPPGTSCTSTGTAPVILIVDNQDFTLTSTTGPISVIPGNVPSGNGLPKQPNQNTSSPQSTIIEIGGIQGFTGTIGLSCATPFSYETCFAGQIVVANNTVQLINSVNMPITLSTGGSSETAPFIFDISMPATLPLGYNSTTAQLHKTAGKMVLAFLPLGFLAFCVRRRRRLSKALWMLIAIAAVSAGMSGCSGNQVAFYTPIPTGPQTVTVTASYPGAGTQPPLTRTYVVSITVN